MSYTLERALSPWVNFLIMPLFALANAGVRLDASALSSASNVTIGIMLGLMIGKPVGITLLSWLSVKLKIGEKPKETSWPMFVAVACLGGIGFTMSIFVDTLSFGDQAPELMEKMRATGKIAVLLGSLCSAIIGSAFVCIVDAIQKRRKF